MSSPSGAMIVLSVLVANLESDKMKTGGEITQACVYCMGYGQGTND